MWYLNAFKKHFIEKVEIRLKDKFFFLIVNKKILVFPIFLYDSRQRKTFLSSLIQKIVKRFKILRTYQSMFKINLQGLSRLFYEVLLLKGIGFRVSISEFNLCLELGYSHPIFLKIPKDLKVFCPTKTSIFVTGANLQKVKEFCSLIQRQKNIDYYKGKGIFFRIKDFKKKDFKK